MIRRIPIPFKLSLGTGDLPAGLKEPISLHVDLFHLPSDWEQKTKARKTSHAAGPVGPGSHTPPYFLPDVYKAFPAIDLKTKVTIKEGGQIEAKEAGRWELLPEGPRRVFSFDVSGEIPATAKGGDIVLVKVAAHYPKIGKRSPRSVEFLEVIHITERAGNAIFP